MVNSIFSLAGVLFHIDNNLIQYRTTETPPSITMVCPVTVAALSLAKKATQLTQTSRSARSTVSCMVTAPLP